MSTEGQTVHPLVRFAVAAFCSSTTEFITFPLDATKTRMALIGEANGLNAGPTSAFAITRSIIVNEGVKGMYAGIGAAWLRQCFYGGTGMALYVPIRTAIIGEGVDHSTAPIWKKLTACMICGGFSQFISTPTDVVKVRLQADRRLVAQGFTPRYTGTFDAFRKIYAEGAASSGNSLGAFRFFYKGAVPNVQRAAVLNAASLGTYDYVKTSINRYFGVRGDAPAHEKRWEAQYAAALICGVISALVSTPFDVVKTRIMNQSDVKGGAGCTSAPQLYSGSVDCLRKTVQKEGVLALYRGFLPCYLRLAPWQIIFYTLYEFIAPKMGIEQI